MFVQATGRSAPDRAETLSKIIPDSQNGPLRNVAPAYRLASWSGTTLSKMSRIANRRSMWKGTSVVTGSQGSRGDQTLEISENLGVSTSRIEYDVGRRSPPLSSLCDLLR